MSFKPIPHRFYILCYFVAPLQACVAHFVLLGSKKNPNILTLRHDLSVVSLIQQGKQNKTKQSIIQTCVEVTSQSGNSEFSPAL